MTLYFMLRANREGIGEVHITRMDSLVEGEDTYRYTVYSEYRGEEREGIFLHNYSEGALVCARKALVVVT
jgi:hypothetical protein